MTLRRLGLVLAVVLVATGAAGPAAASPATAAPVQAVSAVATVPWQACRPTLAGKRVRVSAAQRTVTIVDQRSRTYAGVSFFLRRDGACSFRRLFSTRTARIGRTGTVDGRLREQGSGKTPRGTYTMTEAFGNGAAPPTAMPWHRVRANDYWVGDNASRYYNDRRSSDQGGFRHRLPSSSDNASERLRDYGAQYRYVVVIDFNRAPDERKRGRGFAIFLHVKNTRATAGCIGITAAQMRTVLRHLRPGDTITITR